MPHARVLLLALVAFLLPAATASATFDGSNGKVAYVDMQDQLFIDDPWDDQPATGPIATVGSADVEDQVQAHAHAPAWSPDGTMLAYTAPVPDFYKRHSAVFVVGADGKNPRQVSHPFIAKPNDCQNDCDNGHAAWDMQPTWTPDGDIAFIRFVAAGDESVRAAEAGTTVVTVDPAGGGETRRYHIDPKTNGVIQSIAWPVSSIHPYAVIVDKPGKQFVVRNLGTGVNIAAAPGILDLDAAPVGEALAFTTIVGGHRVHVVDFKGKELDSWATGLIKPEIRFTPDGNAILLRGCAKDRDNQQQHCGLITHRLKDDDADVRPDDPVEAPYLDGVPLLKVPAMPGMRSMFDIQGQDLPVIYLPGFLGSEIQCDGTDYWMPIVPPLNLQPIKLSADGRTNQTCASAGPTGDVVGKFMRQDVYEHANEWLRKLDPDGGWATFGWDWRKAPQDSLDELDAKIDELVAANELGKQQGAERVSLVGHSYGGVLMRLYVDDPVRAEKVARMLTVGSPMWGSIKPFFPLAFGIEAPGFSALDLMVDNENLKDAFRNFAGAYHLLADDNFGQWLHVDQQAKDQAGVKQFLESVGANGPLISDAWRTHRERIDGWLDDNGRIDVRAVVGVGMLTPREVYVIRDPAEGDADVGVRMADGDETVPAHSAWQGEPGGATLGDPIHLQRRCGITHMDQTKDAVVINAYTQFLEFGRIPRKLPPPDCPPQGKLIQVSHDVEIPPPAMEPQLAAAAAADAPLALGDAELAGRRDGVPVPGRHADRHERLEAGRAAARREGLHVHRDGPEGLGRGARGRLRPAHGRRRDHAGDDRRPGGDGERQGGRAGARTAAAGRPAAAAVVVPAGRPAGGARDRERPRRHAEGLAQGRRDRARRRRPGHRQARAEGADRAPRGADRRGRGRAAARPARRAWP